MFTHNGICERSRKKGSCYVPYCTRSKTYEKKSGKAFLTFSKSSFNSRWGTGNRLCSSMPKVLAAEVSLPCPQQHRESCTSTLTPCTTFGEGTWYNGSTQRTMFNSQKSLLLLLSFYNTADFQLQPNNRPNFLCAHPPLASSRWQKVSFLCATLGTDFPRVIS